MRSLTCSQATDMERLFWFSLLLAQLSRSECMRNNLVENCLMQPVKIIWRSTGRTVDLTCTVSLRCPHKNLQYEWFSFKENSHLRLKPLENPLKYKLDGASLRIESLHVNDSGIYHCAAVSHKDPGPGSQYIGSGTTLIVREKVKVMVRQVLLWLSFVLLLIYTLAVVTLIIKKHRCRRTCKSDKRNSTKRKQFRNVLQEMYSRRNLERGKQAVSRSRSPAEAAHNNLNSSNDDIYQNV